jgi:Transposase
MIVRPRADVPEVTTLAETIEAWWPQILAFIDTGMTNAGTEANNRLVKDAARTAVRVPEPRSPAPPGTVALQTDNDQLAVVRVTSPLKIEEPGYRVPE